MGGSPWCRDGDGTAPGDTLPPVRSAVVSVTERFVDLVSGPEAALRLDETALLVDVDGRLVEVTVGDVHHLHVS